ncbi:MAG: hypothetical protein ACR2LE_06315 [Nocardioidaceae bacterium]
MRCAVTNLKVVEVAATHRDPGQVMLVVRQARGEELGESGDVAAVDDIGAAGE